MESKKCLWRSGQRVPLLKAMTKVRILPGTPSLLSSVVERNTLDIVVVGSIPTGDTSLVSSVRQSIGLLIRGSRVQAPHEVHSLFQEVK